MTNQLALDVLSQIKPSIYLSNNSAAKNLSILKTHQITHVLICCSETAPAFPEKFEYKKLNIQETFDFNISEFFQESFDFIEKAINSGGTVLLHCIQGQSRSPTIMCAYLMKKYKMNSNNALKLVKKKHALAQPNCGFLEQLDAYEKKLYDANPSGMTCSACSCVIW